MLTFNEIIELKEKLINGEIELEIAKELFWNNYKEDKRSWHTKDWKGRRAKVIKDKCEICSSKDTLTLQHLSHPRKYFDYERDVTKSYAYSFIESNSQIDVDLFREHLKNNYVYVPVPLCPFCESRRPNIRTRKTPKYLCTECRREFDEPIKKTLDELISSFLINVEALEVRDKCFISKDKWRNKHNLNDVRYWFQRILAKTKYKKEIETEAFVLFLKENIKYLSFENTITACKKCAYSYDIKKMELCPKCKEFYKGVQYSTCIQCLPVEKRKAVLEKVEIGKEIQAMHKSLGID